MKVIALIPARYDSSRFPAKLLQVIEDRTVIAHTYHSAVNTKLFDEVWVVTDSDKIEAEILKNKGKVIKSRKPHESGTDRIAEAAEYIEADIIINIQGDEPFVNKGQIASLIDAFKNDAEKQIDIASLMMPIDNEADFLNPNNVKVVVDRQQFALYFSRAPIPFPREGKFIRAYKHIGIYAFRKEVLEEVARLPVSELEKVEKLENLRFLENGYRIKMLETTHKNIGIDTPEDLEKARALYKNKRK